MSVVDAQAGVLYAVLEYLADRVSRLDVFGNSLKHAQDNGVGSVLDHLFAQLGDNSGLAQFGVRQSFRIDLGVNGLDLGNQLGAGSDQGVNVDLGSFLGVSEFGLQL